MNNPKTYSALEAIIEALNERYPEGKHVPDELTAAEYGWITSTAIALPGCLTDLMFEYETGFDRMDAMGEKLSEIAFSSTRTRTTMESNLVGAAALTAHSTQLAELLMEAVYESCKTLIDDQLNMGGWVKW